MSEPDPIIRQLRESISDNDRKLMESLNKRLELVARLKKYKESRGIGFVDPEREEWMLSYLQRANRGPLSPEGLSELFSSILDLTKCEVADGGARAAGRSDLTKPGRGPYSPSTMTAPTSTWAWWFCRERGGSVA